MARIPVHAPQNLRLMPFHEQYAPDVAGWVRSPQQLRLLAPGTDPPLTPAKVSRWPKPGGRAFLLSHPDEARPIGYGELNPMGSQRRDELWLGHIVVCPYWRGEGIGQVFVRALVSHAFDQLHARRISLIVFPDNLPAVKCYQRAGFVNVGDEYHGFNGPEPRHRFLRFEIKRP